MMTKQALRVHIRWMIRRDMPEVLEIERQGFDSSWAEEDFLNCLRHRNVIGTIAECGERVIGFMIYELYRTKLHIINCAVHQDWRRQGVGAQLVGNIVQKLSSHGRRHITVDVGEMNLDAQLFFRHLGFRAAHIMRGYYEDTGQDAYRMRYSLEEYP